MTCAPPDPGKIPELHSGEGSGGYGMSEYQWDTEFRELFGRCCEAYRGGDANFAGYYSEADRGLLERIGYQPREFFDFVEDHCDSGGMEPSLETAVLVAAVRRDYFRVMQGGERNGEMLRPDDLPGRDSELEGFRWLPRILAKARAKLRGELDPEIMYGCGGDRAFLRGHDIHPADFLRAVWAAGEKDAGVVAFVRERSPEG